jgi:hypothetical protein
VSKVVQPLRSLAPERGAVVSFVSLRGMVYCSGGRDWERKGKRKGG